MNFAPLDLHSPVAWLRLGVALAWLVFGLVFKAFGAVPRHRQIVGQVLGARAAGPVTMGVACFEVTLAVWMVWGHFLPLCAAIQTLAIVTMNALELRYARSLLLSPSGMVAANVGLLAAAWYVALSTP